MPMKLIRWLISAVVLVALVFFALTVPLGPKTLWQHVRAIAGSEESQELVNGVKQKAQQVIETRSNPSSTGTGSSTGSGTGSSTGSGTGTDKLTDEERQQLRELIKDKLAQKQDKG